MDHDEARGILVRAWEAAIEGALEDGLVSLDEENALCRHLDHFGLTTLIERRTSDCRSKYSNSEVEPRSTHPAAGKGVL